MPDVPRLTTFGSLLVANRGEIAVRIIRSARELGLRTVAVYSDADRTAPHVAEADEAVRLGPAPATESYLSIPAILAAARQAGADAIHPGYGFLSERSEFAQAVADAGLVFVGPSASVMERMGRKDLAREIARAAGVPVVPAASLAGDVVDASAIGFPLLIKAAAGGGGKGMRIVRDPAALGDAVASARREAVSAFGDGTLLVERYLEHGRHVEVQVLGDTHGTVLHLGERDCSTQRRHQKVLEEAPAPTISPAVRDSISEAAVALARSVGYTGAGTVEFLVSGDDAYFLEMNTRLQVEHPVTELVTGLDLVALQLLVADGQPLPFDQADVVVRGHAIEARIYAEDAFQGFLPQAGVAELVRWPARARVDAALVSGQVVTTHYDPMLGKVTVHGTTRAAARRAMLAALDDTAILGLTTNLGFLRALVESDAFAAAEIDTAWLDRHATDIQPTGEEVAAVIGAWALAQPAEAPGAGPFAVADGWRVAGPAAPTIVEILVAGELQRFAVAGDGSGAVRCGDRSWTVRPIHVAGPVMRIEVDDLAREACVRLDAHRVEVAHLGNTFVFRRPDLFAPDGHLGPVDGAVHAPMPGVLRGLLVTEGDAVEEGTVLGVLEAMKMEMPLRAPATGRVDRVAVPVGAQVELGDVLFVVAPAGLEADRATA